MATFEFEAWTATVVILTLLCVWCFPALAPALHSLVTEAVTAVPATLGGHTLIEQRFLCPGIRGHTLGRRQASRFFRGFGTEVLRLLRNRQKWSQFGLQLQAPRFKSLFQGIERTIGKLKRTQVVCSPVAYTVQTVPTRSRATVRPVPTRSRAGRVR